MNREHLKLLLEFISKVLEEEGNDWFHDELAILFTKKIISQKDTDIKLSAVTIKELGSIDKYIENGIIPLIDYGSINDMAVKHTLIRDCVEMGKCRFGNFGQSQSFLEFCKYAFFQIEQLVNFYILAKNENRFDKAIEFIKFYNPLARTDDKKTISAVTFSDKIYALQRQVEMAIDLKRVLDNVSYARNESSHRGVEPELEFRILETEFRLVMKKNTEDRSKGEKEIIKQYYYLKFLAARDYNVVTEVINELKNTIIKNLTN